MKKYLEIILAAIFFGACVYMILFGKPQPTSYTGWERDVACMATGCAALWFAVPSWDTYPETRPLLVVALLLALVPSAFAVFNAPFPIF